MKSPLEEAARRRGATFETRLGVVVPAEFAGVEREWRAAREGCAVYDAGIRAWTAAAGADRVSFLQGMLSNDVQTLAAGSGMHALVLTQAAKVVTQVRVHADAERIVLDAPAWHAPLLRETLERSPTRRRSSASKDRLRRRSSARCWARRGCRPSRWRTRPLPTRAGRCASCGCRR
jgi:glycine cleavage system aminomethyltransferase T